MDEPKQPRKWDDDIVCAAMGDCGIRFAVIDKRRTDRDTSFLWKHLHLVGVLGLDLSPDMRLDITSTM